MGYYFKTRAYIMVRPTPWPQAGLNQQACRSACSRLQGLALLRLGPPEHACSITTPWPSGGMQVEWLTQPGRGRGRSRSAVAVREVLVVSKVRREQIQVTKPIPPSVQKGGTGPGCCEEKP